MSGQRISDEWLANAAVEASDRCDNRGHEVYDLVILDLVDARTEIARLTACAAVTERRACDMASSLGEDIARLTAERDEAISESNKVCDSYALENQRLSDERDALLAERAGVSEAMAFGTETDVLYNLEGALIDLDQREADPICRATIRRVIKQLSPLRAALVTPIPAPVDRETIRAEALDPLSEKLRKASGCGRCSCNSCGREGAGELHDHVCTDGEHCVETRDKLRKKVRSLRMLCGQAYAAIRSAAKTEGSRDEH